jgi:hypothetical protein
MAKREPSGGSPGEGEIFRSQSAGGAALVIDPNVIQTSVTCRTSGAR